MKKGTKKTTTSKTRSTRTRKTTEGSPPKTGHTVFNMSVTVPEDGEVAVRLSSKGSLGTLFISNQGIRYSGPNAKRNPQKVIKFPVLVSLHESGLIQ